MLYSLAILLVLSCSHQQNRRDAVPSEDIKYYSFVEKSFDNAVLSLFSSVDTVYLDRVSHSDYTVSNVDKILLNDGKIYILDAIRRVLSEYDYSGKAIRSIGRQGRAHDEYNRISDFTVSPEGDFMILDGTTDHIIRFTRNGDFVERMHLESEVSALQSLSSSRLLMGISLWDNSKSKDYHVLLFDRPGSVVKEMASNTHAIDINVTFPSVGFSESDSGYSYLIPLEDRVYEFDVDGNYVRNYYWDFSPSALSEGARKNVELHMEEMNNGSFLMLAAFVSNNLIIGNAREKGNFKTFIVDRRENTRYMVESKLGYFFGVSSGKAMFVKDSGNGYVLTLLSL